MQFLFAPFWGRLSDRIGRRPVLMIGLLGSVVFYTLFGVATVQKNLVLVLISRIGAGVFGATISTAMAYIADTTTLEKRHAGMAIIGAAFGLGFTFGPLFGYLAVPSGEGDPGPWPGYAAAGLSAFALLLAIFKLPESLRPGGVPAARKLLDMVGLRHALATPSVGLLLLVSFVTVFSFANFETTLALLIKGETFQFTFRHLCLTFAFIGFVLMIAQGVLVRRLSGRISEPILGAAGAVLEVIGFVLIVQSIEAESVGTLFAALTVVVCGFSFLTPSINSLISRRSHPAQQGGILGLGQSVSSLARILGSLVGIPLLLHNQTLPFWLAAGLMAAAILLMVLAGRRGKDFATSE